jgi:hypothetical protein
VKEVCSGRRVRKEKEWKGGEAEEGQGEGKGRVEGKDASGW